MLGCRALPQTLRSSAVLATAALWPPVARLLGPLVPVSWALSRRARNRLLHALNGNVARGPRPGGSGATSGPKGLTPRQLQDPQSVGSLRAAGWSLPPELGKDVLLRVYDTRVDEAYLRDLALEALPAGPPDVLFVGGDFMSTSRCLDAEALDPTGLKRWGPQGASGYHLLIPPRPHQGEWLRRACDQLPLEAPGSVVTVCCIADRGLCPEAWDADAVRRALPGLAPVLALPEVDVRVAAVGERPPLRRVPASTQQLPPPVWETARLALSRVMLLVTLARRGPGTTPFGARWIRGRPPAREPSGLEVLRVEYLLPPATKASAAERTMKAAIRKVAEAMGCSPPAPPQFSMVQTEHGGVVCLLGVPRSEARAWLRGSGLSGAFLRPFWTKDTGPEVQRDKFALQWLRGQAGEAERVWAALRDEPGFYGLLAGGPDIAVRLSPEADSARALQRVRFALKKVDLGFRSAKPGAKWWRLGPLTQAEAANVRLLIGSLGLRLEGDQVRFAAAGHFRSTAFFRASGEPSRLTLDDGGWNSSAAELRAADPPPRRPGPGHSLFTPGERPAPRPSPGGGELPVTAVWGGPRQGGSPPRVVPSAPSPPKAGPKPKAKPKAGPKAEPGPRPAPAAHRQHAAAGQPGAEEARRPTSIEDRLDRLLLQMEDLRAQNAAMAAEMAELRKENILLRRRLEEASGFVHQPYMPPPGSLLPGGADGAGASPVQVARPRTPSRSAVDMSTDDSPSKLQSPEPKRPHLEVPLQDGA